LIKICPTCETPNSDYCYYYENGIVSTDATGVITRNNFAFNELNGVSSMVYLLVGYAIFAALVIYPVEFWRKIPYFIPSILSVYLF